MLPPFEERGGSGVPCIPTGPPQHPLPPGVDVNVLPGSTLGPLLRVDVAKFLAGEKMSLVLTAKRAS